VFVFILKLVRLGAVNGNEMSVPTCRMMRRGDHNATCGYRHFICIDCSQTYQFQDESKHMSVRLGFSAVLLHTFAVCLSVCLPTCLSALCCRCKPLRFLSVLLACTNTTQPCRCTKHHSIVVQGSRADRRTYSRQTYGQRINKESRELQTAIQVV
jgi:hypothetical protein